MRLTLLKRRHARRAPYDLPAPLVLAGALHLWRVVQGSTVRQAPRQVYERSFAGHHSSYRAFLCFSTPPSTRAPRDPTQRARLSPRPPNALRVPEAATASAALRRLDRPPIPLVPAQQGRCIEPVAHCMHAPPLSALQVLLPRQYFLPNCVPLPGWDVLWPHKPISGIGVHALRPRIVLHRRKFCADAVPGGLVFQRHWNSSGSSCGDRFSRMRALPCWVFVQHGRDQPCSVRDWFCLRPAGYFVHALHRWLLLVRVEHLVFFC